MVRVKVCGIASPQQAQAAARLGADLLGLVFAPSRRQVSPQQALEIVQALREAFTQSGTGGTPVHTGQRPVPLEIHPSRENAHTPYLESTDTPHLSVGYRANHAPSPLAERGLGGEVTPPLLVGVFVNQPLAEVDQIAEELDLDYVQLHGDETPEYCKELGLPFIKAFRLGEGRGADALQGDMRRFLAEGDEDKTLFLLDTFLPGVYGGSGRTWDWGRAASLACSFPLLLAGGLTPENVAGVVAAVQPWGVDVSSGVETNGVKDVAKIAAFIKAAKGSADG